MMAAGAYQAAERLAFDAELRREYMEAAGHLNDLMKRVRHGHHGDERAFRIAQGALDSAAARLRSSRGQSFAGLPPTRVIAASSKTQEDVIPSFMREEPSYSVFYIRRG